MNLEKYMQSDVNILIFGFGVGLLATLIAGIIIYLGGRLNRSASFEEEEEEEEIEIKDPIVSLREIWYKKIQSHRIYVPWINVENLSPIQIVEIRGFWVKAKNLQTGEFELLTKADLHTEYMKDDFGDIPKVEEPVEEVKEDEDYMVVEDIPALPAENIIKIDGQDFVLKKVEPKNSK